MKPSSCKAKGRRLQDHVRQLILKLFPSIQEADVKCAIMGESGIDLHLSSTALQAFPYSVECKNTEKLNIWSALQQAEKNTQENTTPLLVFKRNRSKAYVALDLEHFMELVAMVNTERDKKNDT